MKRKVTTLLVAGPLFAFTYESWVTADAQTTRDGAHTERLRAQLKAARELREA